MLAFTDCEPARIDCSFRSVVRGCSIASRAIMHVNGVFPNIRRSSVRPSLRHWLLCERVRAQLEMHELAWHAFAALDMPRGAGIVVRPDSPALPTGIGIIDAAIHIARVKSHWVEI